MNYVASRVESNLERCFRIVECDDPALLQLWAAQWSDLVEFEIVPVVTSAQARAAVEPLL